MDGTVEIRLQAEAAISEIALDAETYEVRAVRAGGEELDFTHEGGTLAIALGAPLAAGETLVLEIDYGGSDIDVDATQYGMAANYDLGLDFKDESEANPQLINTLSFPEGARHWYPSVDHPADRATFELLATVREDWKVLSNGRLLGISEGARPGTPDPPLAARRAPPDLPLSARRRSLRGHRGLPRGHPGELLGLSEGRGGRRPQLPQDNGHHGLLRRGIRRPVSLEQVRPGHDPRHRRRGREPTTATVLGQSTIHDERAEQDFPSHGLVAHEVAHHWWGRPDLLP